MSMPSETPILSQKTILDQWMVSLAQWHYKFTNGSWPYRWPYRMSDESLEQLDKERYRLLMDMGIAFRNMICSFPSEEELKVLSNNITKEDHPREVIVPHGGVGQVKALGGVIKGDSRCHVFAPMYGVATIESFGVVKAGDYGLAICYAEGGHVTVGAAGCAISCLGGEAKAGDHGVAIAGDFGKAYASGDAHAAVGHKGEMLFEYWHEPSKRTRITVAYPGEDGIKPYTLYHWDNNQGKVVESHSIKRVC